MNMKSIVNDETAQTGTILYFLFGIFILGIIYVMFGYIMNENQVANNLLIADTSLPYSQDRVDTMDNIYMYWWAFPIYMILLFAIYAIKKAIDKHSGSAY